MKIIIGIILGIIAGLIDVIPMIIQKLPWEANLSAFTMWVVLGFIISSSGLKINPVLKGIVLSFSVVIPCAVLIGAKEPFSLVPIIIMTLILGGLLGLLIEKFSKRIIINK